MSNFLFYLGAFALVLGVLIFVHESGHFLVARWVGVKVLRFSIGFGRPLISWKAGRDSTEWAIGAFPLGGYVKMLDEREGEVAANELHRSFNRQSVWRRIAIVAAGPGANLLLAIFVYWALFWHGTDELKPVLGPPAASSPAAAAGIVNGEQVLKVGTVAVQTWQEMRWALLEQAMNQDQYQAWVDLEVINSRQEINVRRLDVSSAVADGWEGDALDKLGIGFFRPQIPPVLGLISPDSPANAAGLRDGDQIIAIDGVAIDNWLDVVTIIRASAGKKLTLGVKRDGESIAVDITPMQKHERQRSFGQIGASVKNPGAARDDLMTVVRYAPMAALAKAIRETGDKSLFSLTSIFRMITGDISWRNISGPITIADYAGQSARLGANYYLQFMALVSISLAVLNLLPIPILDGGHLLYYLLEIVMRRPLTERHMEIGQQIGLALMLTLMAFAFYNDINRLISG